jgi:hypothetical protein
VRVDQGNLVLILCLNLQLLLQDFAELGKLPLRGHALKFARLSALIMQVHLMERIIRRLRGVSHNAVLFSEKLFGRLIFM